MPAAAGRSLWPLALLAGALPLVATLIALRLSVALGLVPDCNPFIDGCTSISRAARHGLPNILFRALLLPAAVLQALVWMACPQWLRGIGGGPERALRTLPALGIAAGVFLVLYGSFLGTEGEGYRWMRRYGIAFYFGFTCIGMLIVSDQMHRRLHGVPLQRRISRSLVTLCALLPLLGLAHLLLPLAWSGPDVKDAVENITEWWAGAIFTAFFFVLAWAWRGTRFRVRIGGGE
ncbi:hypothetical protein HLB44_14695 [Aquincola sp. S2]|uniref:DUF998 domain-containing protein n=1 Tax=Pseudaquabacterium terrae TaxID=2732868 RepID=A0ABX2EHY3_9BURK|nr:hypothetical protein [Aquabacterium terrae]NRF68239.1 hypothetical protein [Aquabacterium terrae]